MDYNDEQPWAHGSPASRARFKMQPEDFQVDEILGFEPDGAGEHLFLLVEKRGLTTPEAARRLAHHYKLPAREVSWAGLKDRQALTRQWFGLRLGLKRQVTDPPPDSAELRVLDLRRNSRKLRTGSHRGNRFRIRLRDLQAAPDWEARLRRVAEEGVPNYFGPQRFGHEQDNVARAAAFLAGEAAVPDRFLRGILLSAARAWLFNRLLGWRVADGSWNAYLPGDFLMLDHGRGGFRPEALDETVAQRLREADLHPSGPLWGRGELASTGTAAELERCLAERWPALCQGLAGQGLVQERRALRLRVEELRHWREASAGADASTQEFACGEAGAVVEFALAKGAYATAVLRELAELAPPAPPFHDRQDRHDP